MERNYLIEASNSDVTIKQKFTLKADTVQQGARMALVQFRDSYCLKSPYEVQVFAVHRLFEVKDDPRTHRLASAIVLPELLDDDHPALPYLSHPESVGFAMGQTETYHHKVQIDPTKNFTLDFTGGRRLTVCNGTPVSYRADCPAGSGYYLTFNDFIDGTNYQHSTTYNRY